MADELEYIVKDALMMCDKGAAPGFFRPTYNMTTKINSCLVTTKMDRFPIVNIPSFGICAATQKPCIPVPTDWQQTYKVTVKKMDTLLFRSCMPCGLGGKIEFVTSGQIPLPPDALEDIEKMQHQGAQEEEEGWGWLDTLELVPVIGSIVGAVREGIKGNWGMMALNIGFLAMDIAGLVTFGGTTAAATAAKAGVKAGIKVTAKVAAKTAAKQIGKSGIKTGEKLFAKGTAKLFKSNIVKILSKTPKARKAVFACFPARTPIHTELGPRNIEDIKTGDKVWSYNEETGETALKSVVQVMERETDVTLKLKVGDETIETTAEHPFYTQDGWKDAADLSTSDTLQTKENEKMSVDSIEYSYESKKVFNFAVADWQTYFVGGWAWLVHNALTCLRELANQGVKYAQDILRGNKFNKIMAEKLGDKYVHEVWTKGMTSRIDSMLKGGGKLISRKATQLADISFDTAKKYIDEIGKKYYRKAIQNAERAGTDVMKGKKILQIPKQNNPIPQNVIDYAKKSKVKIDEVIDVTMDMLKDW